MEARSNKPATWSEKSGFLGAVSTMGTYGTRWYLDRCISIGNAGDNYKFLGRNLTAVTTDNVNKCYEYTKVTGKSNVSDNTISRGTLLTTDNIHDIAFYRDTLSFNDDTAGADTRALSLIHIYLCHFIIVSKLLKMEIRLMYLMY